MKRLFTLIGILCGSMLMAQTMQTDTLPPSAVAETSLPAEGNLPASPVEKLKRLQTNISLGTGFSWTQGYGSAFTTFVNPNLSYRAGPRFLLQTGVTIYHTALFGYQPWYLGETTPAYDANFTKALVYLSGSYLVTERLTLLGAVFKEFTLSDNSPYFNPYTRNNPQGIYLNADYRISDGVHIQAGFGYTRGYSPYNSYPGYGGYDPFSISQPGGPFYDPFPAFPGRW